MMLLGVALTRLLKAWATAVRDDIVGLRARDLELAGEGSFAIRPSTHKPSDLVAATQLPVMLIELEPKRLTLRTRQYLKKHNFDLG